VCIFFFIKVHDVLIFLSSRCVDICQLGANNLASYKELLSKVLEENKKVLETVWLV